MSARAIDVHALPAMLTALRLPSFHRHWQALAERADKEGWPAARFLATLAESSLPSARRAASGVISSRPSFPPARPWPPSTSRPSPASHAPAARPSLPATGWKPAPISSPSATRALARPISSAPSPMPSSRPDDASSTPTTDLVQRLQAARRDLVLEQALARLDRFDLVILDDIAYAQKDQSETSVIFELIARRTRTAASPSLPTSLSAPGTGSSQTRR